MISSYLFIQCSTMSFFVARCLHHTNLPTYFLIMLPQKLYNISDLNPRMRNLGHLMVSKFHGFEVQQRSARTETLGLRLAWDQNGHTRNGSEASCAGLNPSMPGSRLRDQNPNWVILLCRSQSNMMQSGWWFGTCFNFPYIGNFIIPTDFHNAFIFFRGVAQPPTRLYIIHFHPITQVI